MKIKSLFRPLERMVIRLKCKHYGLIFIMNLYGDQIIQHRWKRSMWRCAKCDKIIFDDKLFNP